MATDFGKSTRWSMYLGKGSLCVDSDSQQCCQSHRPGNHTEDKVHYEGHDQGYNNVAYHFVRGCLEDDREAYVHYVQPIEEAHQGQDAKAWDDVENRNQEHRRVDVGYELRRLVLIRYRREIGCELPHDKAHDCHTYHGKYVGQYCSDYCEADASVE